jgi:hypothetical protein
MKLILKTTAFAALLSLAACGGNDAAEQKADNIEAATENQVDVLEDAADNATTENAADALENKADAVEAAGENKADAAEANNS